MRRLNLGHAGRDEPGLPELALGDEEHAVALARLHDAALRLQIGVTAGIFLSYALLLAFVPAPGIAFG